MIFGDEQIIENIRLIRSRIGNARLLAATKTVPPEKINLAISHGIDLIGENRVPELLEKYPFIDREHCEIHFIGRLQTNKVKYIIDKVSMIHSVDSIKLAEEISKRALAKGLVMDILIEVNLGCEASKGGIPLEEVDAFAEKIASLPGVRLRGLMAIPPKCDIPEENAEFFEKICKKYIDISTEKVDNGNIDILSIGMSGDYAEAIRHGSNLVRIGSAIFGKRD